MTGTLGTIEGVRVLGTGPVIDLHLDAGAVAAITPSATAFADAAVLLPGLVDLHTHLREPGGEEAETIATGTRAAAAGGFTDVFAMANTTPVTDSVELVEALRTRATHADARVHPIAAATLGSRGERLVDVPGLRAAGVTVFSDDGNCVTDEGLVHELLGHLARHGGVFAQHAQSRSIVRGGVINADVAQEAGCDGWPGVGEEAIVARDIAIARATGGRLHICHVSTKRTVDLIRWAKSVGAPVTAEVTPHHLVLNDRDALRRGTALKVNPPLRSREDVVALRAALLDGTIDIVATDHAPHPAAAKARPWDSAAFGMTGIETAMAIVAELFTVEGRVDWAGLARVMADAPARIGGLRSPGAGSVEVGARADFSVVRQVRPWLLSSGELHSRSQNTPFEGREFRHRVVMTLLEGRPTHSASEGRGPDDHQQAAESSRQEEKK